MPKKRADKRYKKSVTVGRNPDGTPLRKYVYGKTIKEVEQKAAEVQKQLREGTFTADDHVRFIDIAHKWVDVAHPDIMPHTRKLNA